MGAVTMLAFGMFRYVGDPVQMLLGEENTVEARDRLRQQLRLDDPAVVQFARFAWRAGHGDLGRSYRSGIPVAELLMERAPATIELAICAMVLSLVVGVPLGVWTAVHRRRPASRMVEALSLLGVSMPTFLTGMLLMFIFAVHLQWLPAFGRGELRTAGGWSTGLATASGWQSLILPSLTVAWLQTAAILRLVRDEMIEVLDTDFIRFARVRGLPDRSVYFSHALRNAILPVITVSGIQFGTLAAFSVVTESVFQWPGLGLLFVQAVSFADYPVMSAYLLAVALLFVSINFVVDLLHAVADPRLRDPGRRRVEAVSA
jgi:peptide/nickel transport system permease protein